MKVSVVIPTIKTAAKRYAKWLRPEDDIMPMITELERYVTPNEGEVRWCGQQQSAAKNRNVCIAMARYPIVIMVDDDVLGWYAGWHRDLIKPLVEEPERYSVVSIRCLDKKGNIAPMLGDGGSREVKGKWQKALHTPESGLNVCCSAGIAFYKGDGIRFDEEYVKAVWEDTDFCMQYKKEYSGKDIILNNNCQLIHRNEMKNRDAQSFKQNRDYFSRKWNLNI
jgi:hypothetical protein